MCAISEMFLSISSQSIFVYNLYTYTFMPIYCVYYKQCKEEVKSEKCS